MMVEKPLQSRWRLLMKCVGVAAVLGLGVIALTTLNPSLPAGPVELVNDGRGWRGGESRPGLNLQAQFGKIEASNQTTTSSTSHSSAPDLYACRSVTIVNRSDHLLMLRIGPLLQEKLREMRHVEQINYYPPGHPAPQGERGPDLWIDLSLDKAETSGLASRRLQASLRVGFGGALNRCRASYSNSDDAPIVGHSSHIEIAHDSTTVGVGTPSSKYKLAAEDLAKTIAAQIIDRHDDLLEQHGVLSDLPDAFYPAYEPPPAIDLGPSTQRLASHSALLAANETLWRIELEEPFGDWLTGFEAGLAADGWTTYQIVTDRAQLPHLRMTRGEEALTAYDVPEPGVPFDQRPEPTVGFVHYIKRLPREAAQEAYAALIDGEPTIDQITLAAAKLRGESRRRARRLLEERPTLPAEGWLALAKLQRGDDKAAATESLRHAKAVSWIEANETDVWGQIESLAKRLDPDLAKELREQKSPTKERLLQAGVVELDADALPPKRQLASGQSVSFLYEAERDQPPRVITWTPHADGVRYVSRRVGSGSWGAGSGAAPLRLAGGQTVVARFEPMPEEKDGRESPPRWLMTWERLSE